MGIKIVEVCDVTPSPSAAAEQILPLLYFDLAWLPLNPSQTLYFFDFQQSDSHFLDTIVPNLKSSLSLALKIFLPLAGKIVFPLSSDDLPFSHYVGGEDSVPLTISVSDSDFFNLTANQYPRDVAEFHGLVSRLPDVVRSSETIKFSVLAIRVTLFPGKGISIGITSHHAIIDAYGFIGPSGFFQTWASINKLNSCDGDLLLPIFDRSVVEDARSLTRSFWNHVRLCEPLVHPATPLPTGNVKATFVLSPAEIQRLKDFLKSQTPAVGHVSSYVAVTAHVWSCLVQAAVEVGEKVEEDEAEYLSVTVECRARLNPPLAASYFGNCSIFVIAESSDCVQKGRRGFIGAASAIAAAIRTSVGSRKGVVGDAEAQYLRRREVMGKRLIGVSGSLGIDLHYVDYGWGRMRKLENLHIDYNGAFSLFKSIHGGVEVGLSMPKPKMDAFTSIFNLNLSINSNL